MRWLEEKTGEKELKEGTVLYHYSDEEIDFFEAKETCFFTDNERGSGHCHKITLKQDVQVEMFGDEEARFTPNWCNIKAEYLGFVGKRKENNYIWTDKRTEKGKEIEVEAE